MDQFDHILNWKLKQGSHTFPGKDGGTCINEAAIVAAGFPYQPVRSVEDMPACFSRPICRLAMQLNDEASDEERQHLLPFVSRLACADTPKSSASGQRTLVRACAGGSVAGGHGGARRGACDRPAGRRGDVREGDGPIEDVQQQASTPTSVDEHPLFAKIHGWLIGIY